MSELTTVHAYEAAKELPDISGMSYREAFLAVAKSQIGYSEDENGATVYGAWAGDSTQAWCSEFVLWCSEQAGIPTTIIPKLRSSIGYRNFFKTENRFYLLEGGGYNSSCGCQEAATGVLPITDLVEGDILIMNNHTCIFLYAEGNTIYTLDGNSGDMVRETRKNVNSIHGVCKPDFEKIETTIIDTDIAMSSHIPIETPTVEPTETPFVKNQIKKIKSVKKKVTLKKNKKIDVNFKVWTNDDNKVVKNKVKATIKNKKIAKIIKTKVKVGKAIVTVRGVKKGKTIIQLSIGEKTAKTTLKVQ